MNERMKKLRDTVSGTTPYLAPERAVLYTESWKATEGQPVIYRRAKALENILKNMTIIIKPGELIVGNQAEYPVASPVFPEYGNTWLERELDSLPTRRLDKYQVSEETKKKLKPIFDYWRGKSHEDIVRHETLLALPEEALEAWDADNAVLNQAVTNSGKVSCGDGHVIIDYEKVIKVGLSGIIDEIDREIENTKADLSAPSGPTKLIFLKSVRITLEAAICFAERFSQEAARLAAREKDEKRSEELRKISAICAKVPAAPAYTFWEALQSCWFIHLLLQIESNGHSMSLGCFDRYLAPFYLNDIRFGRLNRKDAIELCQCFIVKSNEIKKARQWSHTRVMHGYPMFQTLTLGGQHEDGTDAVNEFTYLVLEAMSDIKMQEPTFVTRLYANSPLPYITACCEAVVKHGGGLPGFFNDEVAIPALMRTGVTLEDARNWAVCGCSELLVPGKHNTINGGACHFNLLKILELSLNNGKNPANGLVLGPRNGGLEEFESYEDVVRAYKEQLDYYLAFAPLLDNVTCRSYARLNPTPFLSALLDHRIQIGKDVEEGGGPNYQNTLALAHGTVNVGNALYNLKTLVFEKQVISKGELKRAIESNFEGEEGKRIQKLLLESPKYGNDQEEVDRIVADVLKWFCTGITQYVPVRGGYYCPTPQTLSANAYTGEVIGATPDGRKAGEATADNISPMAGTDKSGATATLRSVARLDHTLATNGTILNLKLHPTAVTGRERIGKFAALIKGFFDIRGLQVQFNVVSPEVLKEAQKHPEQYRNLIVKVAGYSALFTTLDEKLQDQIIARTEHVV
jgi:pyruvate formate-lyase/glycerol dehydratase family glycyl radical enzyme